MTDINGVQTLYDTLRNDEWVRLEQHRIEYQVTLTTILKYLPPAPARVADIGGGPGRYSLELARRGYQVTLIDLSPKLLDIARRKAAEEGLEIGIAQASACDLSQVVPENDVYDAVLLMGPLYHLVTSLERKQTISQALGILNKSSGVLFTAFISRHAHFRDIATRDPSRLALKQDFYANLLQNGIYNRQSYHAHPNDVRELIGGFPELDMVEFRGCEGILAGGLDKKVNELPDTEFQHWVDLVIESGTDETGLSNSDHLLASKSI
ncbi:hypothetical protein Unana1_07721 [Umbelopsis nana]